MKRKNPYILVAVLWLLTSAIDTTACVVQIYGDNRIVALVFLVLAVSFGIVGGINLQKACEIAEWNRNVRFLEQAHEALNDFVAELERAEENRPFKEFDTPSEVPFEEVRNKEN